MKITVPLTALAAFLGLALASLPVNAQTTSSATTSSTTAPAKPKTAKPTTSYDGTLTAIDPSGASITVTGTKRTLVMAVTPKTKFRKEAPALSDFKVGDKVTGSYTKDASGALTAFSIHKKAAVTATKKPAVAPPTTEAVPAPTPAPTAPAPVTQ